MEKKKYWLKLDKDFLKSPQIKVIKNMENGKDYIIFYLTLMLESIETVGHLRFSDSVPYDDKMLASVTDTNVDIVRSAMKIFCELGLIEILDDKTIYLPNVPEMTGKESESAERVRLYRTREKAKLLQCNSDVTKCNDNIEEDKEEDKEKDKEIEIKEEEEIKEEKSISPSERYGNNGNGNENLLTFVEEKFGRPLSSTEIEHIQYWKDNEITRYAIKQAELARAFSIPYIEKILYSYEKDNITNIASAEERDKKFKEKKFKERNNLLKSSHEKSHNALSKWRENYNE